MFRVKDLRAYFWEGFKTSLKALSRQEVRILLYYVPADLRQCWNGCHRGLEIWLPTIDALQRHLVGMALEVRGARHARKLSDGIAMLRRRGRGRDHSHTSELQERINKLATVDGQNPA